MKKKEKELKTAIYFIEYLIEEAQKEANLHKVSILKYLILPLLKKELKKYGK